MHTLSNIQHNRPNNYPRYAIAFWLTLICLFSVNLASAAIYAHDIQVDFSFDTQAIPGKTVTGYRLYKENVLVCEKSSVVPQSITCADSGQEGTYAFTLSAIYDDGSESPLSAPFPFTIGAEITPPPPPPPPPPSSTGSTNFTFSWEHTAGTDIVAYRFYLNDQKLCESTSPTDTSITCKTNLLNEVMSFSMASVDSLGSESARSNILKLDPADYPELFARKSTTFTWEYNTTGTTVSGFKIYHNDQLICETTDPNLRQLTCDIMLAETNTFRVTAVEGGATETTVSNSIVYAKEATTPGTGTLAAIITTSSQEGTIPFSLTFNGSTSTGPISSYTWSFGDGQTATGATTSYTYQFPGTYTVTLTVADAGGLSHQSSITITASTAAVPPPTNTPPAAVISSSSAVGEAPFTVQFDGSGSTSAQPPIVSHSWDFGDGASGSGSLVAHTFTVAGTYHPTLTVTDSVGLTSQTSTPVLISAAPVVENKPPIPSFTATPTSGKTPFTVSFDASGSSDPDGSISGYVWSFGDGSSASGVSAQHTFTTIADYTVSLQVTDDKGATAASSQTISVLSSEPVPFNFEVLEVQVDHNWKTVAFTKPFIAPIVIAGPPSFADAEPATIRIRNVTPAGFEVHIQEWNYLDGKHAPETFSIIAMEKGTFTLANGAKVEAGSFSGSTAFQKVSLQQPYALTPVILTQVMTVQEADAVTGRVRNSNLGSFEYALQEQETSITTHIPETIGYIAWEPGKGEISGLLYETGLTAQIVTKEWFDLTFQTKFPDLPLFIAGMQTTAEVDTAALRSQGLSKTVTQIKIEEEQSMDTEINHAAEVAGYLAIGSSTATVPPAPSGRQFTFTWEYGDIQNISGFRFYLNNNLLCETTTPQDRQFACNTKMLTETMKFTMTAVFLDGSESTPSGILSISPDDFPDLFGIRLVTYTWEFDSSKENTITGFKVYNNDQLVCEKTDPAVREITCKTQTNDVSNSFTIKAIELSGSESNPSNSLQFGP